MGEDKDSVDGHENMAIDRQHVRYRRFYWGSTPIFGQSGSSACLLG